MAEKHSHYVLRRSGSPLAALQTGCHTKGAIVGTAPAGDDQPEAPSEPQQSRPTDTPWGRQTVQVDGYLLWLVSDNLPFSLVGYAVYFFKGR